MRKLTLLFFTIWIVFLAYCQDQYVVDSILSELNHQKEADLEPYYSELSWQFINSDLKKSHHYAEKALELAILTKDTVQLSDAHNTIAATYYRQGNYASALYHNNQALSIRTVLKDQHGMGASHSKIGLIYTDQGIFDEALFHQLKALDFFIKTEDLGAEAQTYNNICQIYSYLDNLEMAILYANKCIKIYKEVNHPYGEASAIANLAIYYEKVGKLDSCIYFMNHAKDIFMSINDLVDVATSENTIGLYYRQMKKDQEGLKHYQAAYNISLELNDMASLSQYAANLAAVQLDLGKLDEAYHNYIEALGLAKEMIIQRVERQCYEGLANYYEKKGNYKESLNYRKKYDLINTIINNEEVQKSMIQADAKFQNTLSQKLLAEQKLKIVEQDKEQEIANKTIAQNKLNMRNNQLWWTVTVSIIVIALIFYLWISNRKKLEMKSRFSQTLAKEKDLGLQMTLEAQELERQRIAKDLHDGVVQDIVSMKFIMQDLPETPEKNQVMVRLEKSANEVRNISHQMMPFALKELGLISATKDLLERLLIPNNITYEFEKIGDFENRLPERIEISLYRILQELVNNVIKHSKADTVTVTISNRKGNLLLLFEDNGRGLGVGPRNVGLGMTSLDSRVKMLKGKIEFESLSGTTAIINIPLI